MNRLLRLFPVLLSALVVWLAGCKEEDSETPRPSVGRIEIVIAQDSLCLIPGDTVTTLLSVLVHSSENLPMSGVCLEMSLRYTEWNALFPTDSARGDTTDQEGRVEYIYWPQIPSENWIRARADGHSDSVAVVTVEETDILPSITLWVMPDTVSLNPPDSSQISVGIHDPNGVPIVGVTPIMAIGGGLLDTMPPTDSTGHALSYWHPTEVGRFSIRVGFHWVTLCHDDTLIAIDTITVLPVPPIGQVRILATDTVRIVPGDTATAPVTILVNDQEGRAAPNRAVETALSDPAIGDLLPRLSPPGGDLTDSLGRVEYWYHAFGVGVQRIEALCEGVSAQDSIVTIWAP